MKTKKTILIIIIILNSSFLIHNCLSQWVVQSSGVTVNLYDVKFLNRYTGWAVGENGTILKTTNAGNNWNLIPNPSYNMGKTLACISVVDSNYIYVVGGHSTYIKSTNGGNNWIIIRNGPFGSGMGFASVYYLNKDTGWACGNYRVLRTTNAGISFDSGSISWLSINDMNFQDFNTGIICGEGIVFKSSDAGITWFDTFVPTNGYFYQFRKLSVVNKQFVWVVGNGNVFYKSTNFATTWDSIAFIPAYPPSVMYCSYFSSINTGWAGGSYGYLYKTIDGGFNWTRQSTGTDQRFWGSIWFYNDSIGWGVGGAGKIMHTTTGGENLVNIKSNENEVPEIYQLWQNFPNPFNSVTNIKFKIANPVKAKIVIYDILGSEIAILVDEYKSAGNYVVKFNANGLASGVYIYRLITESVILTKKFVLMK
jgi:photosystem II stability/assembly factor-like uncharacterized protein